MVIFLRLLKKVLGNCLRVESEVCVINFFLLSFSLEIVFFACSILLKSTCIHVPKSKLCKLAHKLWGFILALQFYKVSFNLLNY